MAKRLLSSDRLVAFGSAVGAAYIRLAFNTSTVRRDPPDTDTKLFAEHPQIFAMWHGQFGMLPKIKPDRPADVAAMVARHGDGELIAGVLSRSRGLVTNDSGAMHLAAAAGVSVTAVFGPTDDTATRPRGDAHVVLVHPVWCRPCMLRECPLDHDCMRGIGAKSVLAAARRTL